MSEKVWLLMRGVDASRWMYQLRPGCQTAGRSADCEIHVFHETVSRRHAEVWQEHGMLSIRDLGSRNGTFVNNARVTQSSPFAVGDTLRLGHIAFNVVEQSPVGWEEEDTAQEPSESAVGATLLRGAAGLSQAPARVLRLLLLGWSEKRVAAHLFLSRHTVHTHVKHIYHALGVRSRPELLARYSAGTIMGARIE